MSNSPVNESDATVKGWWCGACDVTETFPVTISAAELTASRRDHLQSESHRASTRRPRP